MSTDNGLVRLRRNPATFDAAVIPRVLQLGFSLLDVLDEAGAVEKQDEGKDCRDDSPGQDGENRNDSGDSVYGLPDLDRCQGMPPDVSAVLR